MAIKRGWDYVVIERTGTPSLAGSVKGPWSMNGWAHLAWGKCPPGNTCHSITSHRFPFDAPFDTQVRYRHGSPTNDHVDRSRPGMVNDHRFLSPKASIPGRNIVVSLQSTDMYFGGLVMVRLSSQSVVCDLKC